MNLTIDFDGKWVERMRKAGTRVVRHVERWIGGRGDVKLKTSTGTSVTVTMEAALRPRFAAELERMVASTFGVKEPLKVLSYAGAESARKETAPTDDEKLDPETPNPQEPELPFDDSTPSEETPAKTSTDKPSETPDPVAADKVLADLLQTVPLRHSRAFAEHFRETARVVPMLRKMDALESFWRKSLLVAVDDGYGLTEFLGALARLYVALGLVKEVGEKTVRELTVKVPENDICRFEDWNQAVDVARDMDRANVRNGAGRAILCLDIRAWQGRLGSQELKTYLRKLNVYSGSFTLVFRVPFVDARTLVSAEDALSDVFDIRTLMEPPVTLDGLADYARDELAKRTFELTADATEPVERWIIEEKRDDSFFGYRTVDKMVGRLIYAKALSNCSTGEADRTVCGADVDALLNRGDKGEGDPEEALDELVGLSEVKTKIREIVAQIKTQRKLSSRGRKVRRPAIHMLFSGNPGTGKTTVARLVARILRKEGVLRKGHLLEVKGRDLCGEYIGQTAPKTSAICRDAYGSVLFIDEAYSLFRGDGNDRDYGREALDTLIAEMENHRDDLCVIMAGYTEDMEKMLGGNEGLRSRIPYAINFPDYSREELQRIFFAMADGSFEHEKSLEKALKDYFDAIPDEVLKARGFANARFVRNLYERTWGKAAYRSRLEDAEDVRLLASDLVGATEEREFKQLMERSARRPIGFGAWVN